MSTSGRQFVISISAGEHDREHTPLCLALPGELAELEGEVTLRPEARGKALPGQIERCGEGVCLWTVLDKLPRGETRRFTVAPASRGTQAAGVRLRKLKDKVRVEIAGEMFTEYVYAGKKLARPYLYPLVGPGGAKLTRRIGWQSTRTFDHPHHKSVWVAHGLVNGTDNWSEGPGHGYTKHVRFTCLQGGPASGCLTSENVWTTSDGQEILRELRAIRFFAQPAHARCFDVTITFCAGEAAVLFGDTKEGGLLSVRVQPSMNASGAGTIENSYGAINEGETWGKRAMWCDYSGPVGEEIVGLAIFDHPENYGYPTYWHVRNYGLMTANPFGLSYFTAGAKRGDWLLGANSQATFRYRVYIHRGGAREGRVAERFHDWVNPPLVELG